VAVGALGAEGGARPGRGLRIVDGALAAAPAAAPEAADECLSTQLHIIEGRIIAGVRYYSLNAARYTRRRAAPLSLPLRGRHAPVARLRYAHPDAPEPVDDPEPAAGPGTALGSEGSDRYRPGRLSED
ncbi:hypothetical protein GSY69_10120, partial [Brevibacterium sp. 5221]